MDYLESGEHPNIILQREYDEYGLDNFKFEILEECTNENIDYIEKYHILKNCNNSYNIVDNPNYIRKPYLSNNIDDYCINKNIGELLINKSMVTQNLIMLYYYNVTNKQTDCISVNSGHYYEFTCSAKQNFYKIEERKIIEELNDIGIFKMCNYKNGILTLKAYDKYLFEKDMISFKDAEKIIKSRDSRYFLPLYLIYLSIGSNAISVSQLQEWIGVDSYNLFGNINLKVIKPFNNNSKRMGVCLNIQTIKSGKKAIGIRILNTNVIQ